jgi:hypothetical protein
MRGRAEAMGEEFRAKGVNIALAPALGRLSLVQWVRNMLIIIRRSLGYFPSWWVQLRRIWF